ncbi:MAG: type II toxin-antitoxin system MqsA family antitoxin [Treponema sp.]|nr:type II toxin-antitoxin system MqsA family antitoxin [Treponema sp.]
MKCPICKFGEMKEGFTQVVLTRGSATVIFRSVPAKVCDDCGEYYLDEPTAQDVYERAEKCFSSGQEVAIIEYKTPVRESAFAL